MRPSWRVESMEECTSGERGVEGRGAVHLLAALPACPAQTQWRRPGLPGPGEATCEQKGRRAEHRETEYLAWGNRAEHRGTLLAATQRNDVHLVDQVRGSHLRARRRRAEQGDPCFRGKTGSAHPPLPGAQGQGTEHPTLGKEDRARSEEATCQTMR